MAKPRLFVGTLIDHDNRNAQVNNVKNLLSRWSGNHFDISVSYYGCPDPRVVGNDSVYPLKLMRRHLWYFSQFIHYQRRATATFYNGCSPVDQRAWRFRKWTGRRIPLITTIEGIMGDAARSEHLSKWAGHVVHCQHAPRAALERADWFQRQANHNIAISPFLARVGEELYGKKYHVVPLGVDSEKFGVRDVNKNERFTVVGCGSCQSNKRPELFITLGEQFPEADFIWFGEGGYRERLVAQVGEKKLTNVAYPGSADQGKLALFMNQSHLFLLPSLAEGVPKVTQEAAACGIPVIIFGYYGSFSVVNEENGYVVWNDDDMFERVGDLIHNPAKAEVMGKRGAEMAKGWNWDVLAPRWEDLIAELLDLKNLSRQC